MRQRRGGISRLFSELTRSFDEAPELGVDVSIPVRISNNSHLKYELPDRGFRVTPSWMPRSLLYAPVWALGSHVPLGFDLVHRTYYSKRFLGTRAGVKQVCTVYDMIPEIFAGTEHFTATHLSKQQYVEQADLVICISESTREDMESFYGEVARKSVVIPLGVRDDFGLPSHPLPGLPNEYLLYVGARRGYKDFQLLPAAMEAMRASGFDVPLVIVGSNLDGDEVEAIRCRNLESSIVQVQLSDSELKRAYSHSSVLVQTSRYEGFGLTPLEAMASGIPVVVANASSMPEVGGDVAQYFVPGNSDSLAEVLMTTLSDSVRSKELGELGRSRASGFSVDKMAQRTATAYRDLLS